MDCQSAQPAIHSCCFARTCAADGYCNSRVAEFDGNGTWVRDYQTPQRREDQMEVPHRWAGARRCRDSCVPDTSAAAGASFFATWR